MAEWQAAQTEAKARAKTAVDTLAARLRDLAPLVFGDEAVPLAIGIHRDIAALLGGKADKATIGLFLRRWTRRAAYLKALARGEPRRDLGGHASGEPTIEQRETATRWLERREVAICARSLP